MKIYLNTKLLRTLSQVLFLPSAELITATGIPTSTWYYCMGKPDKITIDFLLSIANGLNIPVRKFFSTENTDIIGRREDYIAEPYLPCYYDEAALQRYFAVSHEATWQRASLAANVTPTNLRRSLLAVTRLPVERFLVVCEAFDIDPFTILIDPNPETTQTPNKPNKRNAANDIEQLKQQIAQLSSEIADLKKNTTKRSELTTKKKPRPQHVQKNKICEISGIKKLAILLASLCIGSWCIFTRYLLVISVLPSASVAVAFPVCR